MEKFRDILRKNWGYDDFRGIQPDIIRSIAGGHDTLGLMPTGGGKSITFQVPSLAMEGMTIVVTPLIALMKDQVENLCMRGIRAATIHGGLSHEEILKHLDNSVYGAYKFLYVSPERLGSELFQAKLRRMKINFITVDEAHCISQWGYDFRPAYLQIAEIRNVLPGVPVLALTATATPRVVDDICRQLNFPQEKRHVFRMSFARPNLRYIVRRTEDKEAEIIHILSRVGGAAIVYTRSRQGTGDVARLLNENGIKAISYHAGLSETDKDVRQRAWQEGETRVMVATNAFGMGIDKSDVRLVVHMDLPDSVEAYFQEAGRAGHDGQKSYAVLLYNNGDHGKMLRRIPETFPPREFVDKVYEDLGSYFQLGVGYGEGASYEFNIDRFCTAFKHFPVQTVSALRLLTRAGYIDFREETDNTSRLFFLVRRDELYGIHHFAPLTEEVLHHVLRNYSGVFSDYVCIDESLLAHACECTPHEVYEILKMLSRQRIIHYIPRKKIPHITYLVRRLANAPLSRNVYDERRDDYVRRIESILQYASTDAICRSRYLLDYFADSTATDCGHCDVCIGRRKNTSGVTELAALYTELLADGSCRDLTDFPCGRFDESVRILALQYLSGAGLVRQTDKGYVICR